MLGVQGRDWSLPLLPAGAAMFEALPFEALVLDRLGPAVGNGVITLHDAGQEGVLIIRDGVVSESVWVADGVRRAGDEALALIHGADAATVSACHLSDEAMRLIGPLIRGEPCYAGLRLEWVVWAELLSDLRSRGGVFVVELSTPTGRGVTLIDEGRQVATYVEAQPSFGDPSLLDGLAAAGVGVIRVLSDPGVRAGLQPGGPALVAAVVGDPARELAPHLTSDVIAVRGDDPNATLTAFFGPYYGATDRSSPLAGRQPRPTPVQVEAVLLQLKLLVHNRLQRSSASVDELIDSAADSRQDVAWLADRVRVMTVRGFQQSTFDQLADEMLALVGSGPT